MSLTRLHSQTAPPTRRGPHRGALIVIGHGTGARAGDGALHQLVADIAAQEIYGEVYGAVLHGVPSLGDVLAKIEAPGPVDVLPYLMSDGVVFQHRLGDAIANIPWQQAPVLYPPLGLNPGLSELLARRAEAVAVEAAWRPGDCHLLLVAHGSCRCPASASTAQMHQQRIAALQRFAGVSIAFLDQAPFLRQVMNGHDGPLLALSLLVGQGRHGKDDIAEAFAQAVCPAKYCGAVGDSPDLAMLAIEHMRDHSASSSDRRALTLDTHQGAAGTVC
ncbi:MAG: hypothetical protein HOK21_25460 [Rhodospirillaceae bacterium]|jgi:sirohydrochlorin ferrochelatase|nr:hypothetical protein [Rhodospirillaceae bacterium]MBT4044832.1 hypothetical protein [Rhodospirillaceae bacterium]MBT4690071.1 hypothetical protein [Rhodospirillaceae bacterium]MBT5079188.1 hypothetical protein [Rhodospirillaceae bacterium]MBT5527446.1 hypothetical protein [Rhodospirillaceae bacterium]